MPSATSYIKSGPTVECPIEDQSIGEFLLNRLKGRNLEHELLVDGSTKKILQNGQVLINSIKGAKLLQDLGIKKGDTIAIISESSPEHCVAMLSALYRGITVHLITKNNATDKLQEMLSESRPKLILCASGYLSSSVFKAFKLLNLNNVKLLFLANRPTDEEYKCVEVFNELIEQTPFQSPDSFEAEKVESEDQKVLIATTSGSGSNDSCKSIVITHENLKAAFTCFFHEDFFKASTNDVILCHMPKSNILSTMIALFSVAVGIKLVIVNSLEPHVFEDCIRKFKPTKLFLVPLILTLTVVNSFIRNCNVSRITDVIVGGKLLEKEFHEKLQNVFTNAHVRHFYAATETTGICTMQKYRNHEPGNIGVLIPNMLAKVCDCKTKEEVGPMKVGEICFKGPTIMKEYLENESDTNASFDEEGFYKTGDLGYYDEDGNFYFVYRLEQTITYKGIQVFPDELEAVIMSHPLVEDCGVAGIPDETAGQVPFAIVVTKNDIVIPAEEIINYVAERMPVEKQLHGGLYFTDELPKDVVGKISRPCISFMVNDFRECMQRSIDSIES